MCEWFKIANNDRDDRPTVMDRRESVNALLYLNRTNCQWRLLPTDFPNWNTVRYYINDVLRGRARQKVGRN